MIKHDKIQRATSRVLKFIFVCIFVLIGRVEAQTYDISGYVLDDETGEPLIGASLVVKDTQLGCVTDQNGYFKLSLIPSKKRKLIVSFIGMEKQEVNARSGRMEIRLRPDIQSLNEVVVQVAYGMVKKESLIGSVSSVNAKDIEYRPVTSLASVLDGTTTGVMVGSVGQPGEDATLLIRGFSSVNGSNLPLYVVDGMVYSGRISDLNMMDIESVSVLKDAASAALYGNRASNGVVLITTKHSKSKELRMRLSIKQGLYTRGISEYERLGTDDFMEAMWLSNRNSLVSLHPDKYPTPDAANAAANASIMNVLKYNIYNVDNELLFDENGKLSAGATVRDIYKNDLDWYSPIQRTGYRQEYNISGEGGGEKSDYYVSLGYLDEDGYMKNTGFDRLTLRANLNLTPRKWLKFGLQANGTYQNIQSGQTEGAYATNAFYSARLMAPIYPVHLHNASTGDYILDASGNKQYDDGSDNDRPQMAGRHLIWENELNSDKTHRNTLAGQAYAEIRFLRDFTFTVKGNMSLTDSERRVYQNGTVGDAENIGRSYRYNYRYKTYQMQEQLRWQKILGSHYVDGLLAHENYSFQYNYLMGRKDYETFPGKDEWSNFSTMGTLTDYKNNYRTESYLGRVRYNYNEKYFAEASFRYDGSSRFHPDHRWGGFWSVGGAWILSKENFLKDVEAVDFLKLRASYGEVGNDAGVDYYGYMGLYKLEVNGGEVAAYKSQNEAKDIRWETASSLGIAVEASLLKRWNISVEYFDKRSKDLLFDVNLPLSVGANSTSNLDAMARISKNIGTMSNRGWELQTDVDVIRNKEWKWNVGMNLTLPWNKVVELPEKSRKAGVLTGNWRFLEGHSMYEWWLTQFAGVDQMTGNSLYEIDYEKYYIGEAVEGKTEMPAENLVRIGEEYYTTNASIARKDWSGDALPRYYGSFSTSLKWKNLSFSALLTYSVGGKIYDASYASLMAVGTAPHALHKDVLNSWNGIPEGMTEDSPNRINPDGIPILDANMNIYNNATSNRFLKDASYVSMKNVTLSYSMPASWVRRLDLNSVNLDFSIENWFYLTKRKGLNPQESFDGSTNNRFVSPRIFSLGLTVKL